MSTDLERLEEIQDRFRDFAESKVYPKLRLAEHDRERLGHKDIADRIDDKELQSTYIDMVIELLNANIKYYKKDATEIKMEPYSSANAFAYSLFAAAIALWQEWGLVVSLVLAGVVCISADGMLKMSYMRRAREADIHNADVSGWQDTLNEWHSVRLSMIDYNFKSD